MKQLHQSVLKQLNASLMELIVLIRLNVLLTLLSLHGKRWIDGVNSGMCQQMTSCSDAYGYLQRINVQIILVKLINHMKNYNICALKNDKCTEIDPTRFDEKNCYEMSGNLYHWNHYLNNVNNVKES